jgi:molybdenum cofactor synthesis domain-containing protein
MQIIPVKKAVGMVLGHDITEIVPGQFKGAAFTKGHIVKETDIPRLLNIGKKHIYVMDLAKDMLHENEAAQRMAKAAIGPGISLSDPHEGKVEFIAAESGLLKIDPTALEQINLIEEIMFATIHGGHIVQNGQKLGGTRIIPLAIAARKIETVEAICRTLEPVIAIKPIKTHTVGIVTTGSEVYHGRIEDKFGRVLEKKFAALGSRILRQIIVDDDIGMIANAITALIEEGADFIATTGGMSVDPDDVTPAGIKTAGGSVLTYGAPVLPGAMFLLAKINDIPIVGLPACVMYYRTSIFDLIVPRLLAQDPISKTDIARLGYGGYCMNCQTCRYPQCGFGKSN